MGRHCLQKLNIPKRISFALHVDGHGTGNSLIGFIQHRRYQQVNWDTYWDTL